MPHLTIEYSANLGTRSDIAALCVTLHATLLQTGLFELGAIRVRTLRSTDYAVADLVPENSFADLRLRIGAGRSQAEKHKVGEVLFATATAHFAPLLATPHFALSLDIAEIDASLSWKKNAIHPRLRAL